MSDVFRERFEEAKDNLLEIISYNEEEIERVSMELEDARNNGYDSKVKELEKELGSLKGYAKLYDQRLHSLRLPTLSDVSERSQLYEYASLVKRAIPNDVLLGFHGCGNINSVEDIIKSGGLYPEKNRGIDSSWSSSIVCFCTKNDIRESIDIANSHGEYSEPYGAIFVISPGNDSQKNHFSGKVFSLPSADFNSYPLVAIITTNENLDRLKKVVSENGFSEDIVINHRGFIEMCESKYGNNQMMGHGRR